LPSYGISFALTAAFALIIFYAGGFGGADAKALMSLALALPFYPTNLLEPLSKEVSPISQSFFPLSIFTNSVLIAALTTVAMLAYNLAWRLKTGRMLFEKGYVNGSWGRKILILITGYKTSVGRLKEKWHIYPLEDVESKPDNNNPKRRLLALPKDEGRDGIVGRLAEAVKNGTIQDNIWATPGLPFLIFLTAGLVLALFIGDIVWICISLVL
jgi:preflagellin peptidase FlaK